mgnify:CR=1 FL=1
MTTFQSAIKRLLEIRKNEKKQSERIMLDFDRDYSTLQRLRDDLLKVTTAYTRSRTGVLPKRIEDVERRKSALPPGIVPGDRYYQTYAQYEQQIDVLNNVLNALLRLQAELSNMRTETKAGKALNPHSTFAEIESEIRYADSRLTELDGAFKELEAFQSKLTGRQNPPADLLKGTPSVKDYIKKWLEKPGKLKDELNDSFRRNIISLQRAHEQLRRIQQTLEATLNVTARSP